MKSNIKKLQDTHLRELVIKNHSSQYFERAGMKIDSMINSVEESSDVVSTINDKMDRMLDGKDETIKQLVNHVKSCLANDEHNIKFLSVQRFHIIEHKSENTIVKQKCIRTERGKSKSKIKRKCVVDEFLKKKPIISRGSR